MNPTSPTTRHRIYLLTVWREAKESETDHGYRFMLEDPHSGEGFGFTTFDGLIKILEELNRDGETKKGSKN